MNLPCRPVDRDSGLAFARRVALVAGKGSRAWDVHTRGRVLADEGRDVIFLSVGDPDFETPAPIVEAAVGALRAGRTHYTWMGGIPPLREAIAARYRARGIAVSADRIMVTPGAQNALFATMLCLVEAGDEVIVPEPAYVTYEAVVGATGARMVTVPLDGERGFHLDPSRVAAAVGPRTRAVLLNSPHNPTGAVIGEEALGALAAICRDRGLWLVSDEVYATLTYEVPHRSPLALADMAGRTAVVDSLSKSYAMSGWRLGWVVAPAALMPHLEALSQCMLYGCPPFIQDAAVVALTHEFAEIEAMRAAFRARRDRVVGRLNAMPYLGCRPPEAGMFAMLDVRATGLSAHDFAFRLVETEGVSLLPGDGFGPSAEGYVRLSLTAPSEVLDAACDRIARFVAGLNR